MKTKIMALILAVGLGVTGVAVTAQAAEKADTCTHSTEKRVENFAGADYWNGNLHMAAYSITIYCGECGVFLRNESGLVERLEPHDYEQIYFQDGSVMSYCTGCKDQFYW